MVKKKKLTIKDVKKDPMLNAMYEVELVHQTPSHALIHLRDVIEMELKDRKYLKKKNWMERMLNWMGSH